MWTYGKIPLHLVPSSCPRHLSFLPPDLWGAAGLWPLILTLLMVGVLLGAGFLVTWIYYTRQGALFRVSRIWGHHCGFTHLTLSRANSPKH